jgi:hypothetical protein
MKTLKTSIHHSITASVMALKSNADSKRETFYGQMKMNHEMIYKNLMYIDEYIVVLERALSLASNIPSSAEKPAPPIAEAPPVIVEISIATKNYRIKIEELSSRLSRIVTELTQG